MSNLHYDRHRAQAHRAQSTTGARRRPADLRPRSPARSDADSKVEDGALLLSGDRLVLSVSEAAALLGISRALAYELVARGDLPSIRLGRRLVVPKVALLEMLGLSPHRDH